MYESPIRIIESAIESFSTTLIRQREDAIILEVQRSLGVEVDKGELLRALQYDRLQYDKGYADGRADAISELVRCKDCTHFDGKWFCKICGVPSRKPDDFCSCGERKD